MAIRPAVFDGGLLRPLQVGDVLVGGETTTNTLTTAGAGTITAAMLTGGILTRSGPGAGFTDTTDTAANIVAALAGQANLNVGGYAVPNGTTDRLIYINTVAFAMTLAAGSGVTLGANVNIAASSVKDYLITVTNGTPPQIFAATVDGSTKVITGLSQTQTNLLSVGMAVTGTGIAASSVIASIQPGVGVTLNNNTTVAGSLVALTFNPTITITSLGQKLL